MSTVTKAFEAVGVSAEFFVRVGQQFTYEVSGTFVGTVILERNDRSGKGAWQAVLSAITAAADGTLTAEDPSGRSHARYRWRCSAFTSGTIETSLADVSTDVQGTEQAAGGETVLEYIEDGVRLPTGKKLTTSQAYSGADSFQPVEVDLELAAGTGVDDPDTSHVAPVMGHVFGDDALTKTGNYIAGVIGKFTVAGAHVCRYALAGIAGIIGDGVSVAHGAVVAILDGDSAVTRATAFFKALNHNTTPGSGVDYGLDLASGHDAYPEAPIAKAALRLDNDVVILTGDGAPVDGTTGDDFAGPGSLYIDYTNANHYIQTGAIDDPVWKLVTRAA